MPEHSEAEVRRRLGVAEAALMFFSTHFGGTGGVAPWRLQRAAVLAALGDPHWQEPLTRPSKGKKEDSGGR